MGAVRSYVKPGDVLLALVLIPLVLAASRLTRGLGADLGDTLLNVGRAAGILGLSIILVAGILSVRVPGFDRLFGGLPRLWKIHHILGFLGFVLVLFHVELIAVSALPIARDLPVKILFPPLTETGVWWGWLALLTLVLFLAPSFKFFGHPPYQPWKLLHQIAAPAALVLAVLHANALTSGDDVVWWLFGGLAALSVLWRRAGVKLLGRLRYSIVGVDRLAPDVVEISLSPRDRPLRYAPGQFIYLSPLDSNLTSGRKEEHPFSLSSAPSEPVLKLGIKDLGDASHALQTIAVGSEVRIEGPYGDFFARITPDRDQLWLGGGIGITPMVGGARALASRDDLPPGAVHLFYLADSPERAYYRTILRDCEAKAACLRVTEHYFAREGAMTAAFLAQHCPDFREREVYLCGPPPMLHHLGRLLSQAGVPRARIHSEEFTFL